jgi:hypothetical protein
MWPTTSLVLLTAPAWQSSCQNAAKLNRFAFSLFQSGPVEEQLPEPWADRCNIADKLLETSCSGSKRLRSCGGIVGEGTLPQQVWEALQVATNLVAAFDAASVIHHL